jgi:hypothetical protein
MSLIVNRRIIRKLVWQVANLDAAGVATPAASTPTSLEFIDLGHIDTLSFPLSRK